MAAQLPRLGLEIGQLFLKGTESVVIGLSRHSAHDHATHQLLLSFDVALQFLSLLSVSAHCGWQRLWSRFVPQAPDIPWRLRSSPTGYRRHNHPAAGSTESAPYLLRFGRSVGSPMISRVSVCLETRRTPVVLRR